MESERRFLENNTFHIEWAIYDFNTMVEIADACASTDPMQFETNFCQKPYEDSDDLTVKNRWVFFLRKPEMGGRNTCTMGVKREVLNFHEGYEAETPFGVKVTFRIDDPTHQAATPVLTESEVFYLKIEESKKWEVCEMQRLLDATNDELLKINVTFEIYVNDWVCEARKREMEEAEELQESDGDMRAALREFYARPDLPFADFSIKVVDGNKTFRVNKCIIGALSPVFMRMCCNEMFVEGQEGFVTIIDMTAEAVEHLVAFIYGKGLMLNAHRDHREANAEIIMQLVDAAERYQIPSLKTACDQQLEGFFTRHNAFVIRELCVMHNLPVSTPKIQRYINDHCSNDDRTFGNTKNTVPSPTVTDQEMKSIEM